MRRKYYYTTTTPVKRVQDVFIECMKTLFTMSLCVTIGIIIFVALLEFTVGCGEKTYYADGTWQTNKCAFIPHDQVKGTWQ